MPDHDKFHVFWDKINLFVGSALEKGGPTAEPTPTGAEAKAQHLAGLIKSGVFKSQGQPSQHGEVPDHETGPIGLNYKEHHIGKAGTIIPVLVTERRQLIEVDVSVVGADDDDHRGSHRAEKDSAASPGAALSAELPDGVEQLSGGRYSVELNSRGITVAANSLTQALTLRDADDVVTTARSRSAS